jgi:hypothetical protein
MNICDNFRNSVLQVLQTFLTAESKPYHFAVTQRQLLLHINKAGKSEQAYAGATATKISFFYHVGLAPLACFLSELIWNCRYDSLDGGSALPQGCYLHMTTQAQKKLGQTTIHRAGFESMIPVSEIYFCSCNFAARHVKAVTC